MSVEERWTTLRRKQSLSYPYSPQISIFLEPVDSFGRAVPCLLKSLLSLAAKMLDKAEELDETDGIMKVLNILSNDLQFDDLEEVALKFGMRNTDTSAVIFCESHLPPDDTLDWSVLRQVVILNRLSSTKAAIYYLMINTGVVDVFSLGQTRTEELQVFGSQILSHLGKYLPDVQFTFAFRFRIPRSFELDTTMMALIFTLQLHRHGKYLLFTQAIVQQYKLKAMEEFHEVHDKWLGKMTSKSDYPFIVERTKEEVFKDEGGVLTQKGWILIDVPGFGNCGYHSLLLGLDNNSKHVYNPLYVDERREPIDPNDMARRWNLQVVRLRRDLRGHSTYLLNRIYKRGQEPAWWWEVGPLDRKDEKENHDSFFETGKDEKYYFRKKKLPAKSQMMTVWGPFVFASFLRIRVIVISRTRRPSKEDKNIVDEWSTWIFSKRDNVKPIQQAGVHRMPDDEFRKQPTIEIFHIGGEGKDVDNHYQFLRRGYCDGAVQPLTTEPENGTLLSILKEQFRQKKTAANVTNEVEREATVDGSDREKMADGTNAREDVTEEAPGTNAQTTLDASEREKLSEATNNTNEAEREEAPGTDTQATVDGSERERMPAGTNDRENEEPSEKDNHDKQIAFAGEDV
ncbi:hypothetical protein G9A89_021675, partial [Geosiphon pyriformis]